MSFFDKEQRSDLIKRCKREWNQKSLIFHTDKFNTRVADKGMRKMNQDRFTAMNNAFQGLVEWDEVAREPWKKRKEAADGKRQLEHLECWEAKICVQGTESVLDFEEFMRHVGEPEVEEEQPPKRQRRS
jgi:hypothetical protein